MIFRETARGQGIDLFGAIRNHSADEILPYKTVSGRSLSLACFYPADYQAAHAYPLILMIHGGAWNSRKVFDDQTEWAGDYLGFLARLFSQRDYVALSVDYRLLPDGKPSEEVRLEDLIQDCCDAVDFIRRKFKPESVELLGESAGGYLAAAVDMRLAAAVFHRVILVNPITDLTLDHWGAVVLDDSERITLSPALHISAQNSPTLLIHGDADATVSPEHSLRYHMGMQRAGAPCDLLLLQGAAHAFLLPEYYENTDACETAIMWMWGKEQRTRKDGKDDESDPA